MKVTKKAINDFVRNKLKTDEVWAKKALLKIYEFQTQDEKDAGYTRNYNNVGFSGVDGEILSAFAVFFKKRGYLSKKQMAVLKKKIHKYTRQIISVADAEKLENLVRKSIIIKS